VINSEKYFINNTEIVQNSLKLTKLFLRHKKFKEKLIDSIGIKHLIPIGLYYTDTEINKLVLKIIKELLSFVLNSEITNDIYVLVFIILKNNSDNLEIAESVIGILKNIVRDVINLLVCDESIESYCMLFICMKGEIEFEMLLLSLFKLIKDCDETCVDVLRNNKKIQKCVLDLLESYSIASTGSESSNETIYLKLKVLAEDVLGLANN
jgi:hypothetical protein